MSDTEITDWTVEELALIAAAQSYFACIAACMSSGGRTQEALLAAMPKELREQPGMEMMAALGGI